VYWMHLALGKNHRLAPTNMAMKLWFPLNVGSFSTTDCLIKKDCSASFVSSDTKHIGTFC
jgi:hypothetical protein